MIKYPGYAILYTCVYIHTYIHTYIQTYIHTYDITILLYKLYLCTMLSLESKSKCGCGDRPDGSVDGEVYTLYIVL